jgi:hypothetical protein
MGERIKIRRPSGRRGPPINYIIYYDSPASGVGRNWSKLTWIVIGIIFLVSWLLVESAARMYWSVL